MCFLHNISCNKRKKGNVKPPSVFFHNNGYNKRKRESAMSPPPCIYFITMATTKGRGGSWCPPCSFLSQQWLQQKEEEGRNAPLVFFP
jgi:hypothetical protein